MRLVVRKDDSIVNEFQFSSGPVYIGRHADSQIFLPDRVISRHHAVIFSTKEGKWMVEDLDSANKTYLNDEPIHKAEIKTGDCLRVTDFSIEINLEDDTIADKPINLEDTLPTVPVSPGDIRTSDPLEPQLIIRRLDAEHAPDITLPAKRAMDFVRATEAICRANGLEDMLSALLKITAKQFNPYHVWCALRNQPEGSMVCYAGKRRDGSSVELSEIKLNEKITYAVEKNLFLLMPRIPPNREKKLIHSAIIAPVTGHAGCFGVIYIDNDMAHSHYSLSDLDYLMLLAIHTSVIVENF